MARVQSAPSLCEDFDRPSPLPGVAPVCVRVPCHVLPSSGIGPRRAGRALTFLVSCFASVARVNQHHRSTFAFGSFAVLTVALRVAGVAGGDDTG